MPFEIQPPFQDPTPAAPLPIQVYHSPPPPRDVKLTLLSFATGTWRLDWRDAGPYSGISLAASPVTDWIITTTPVSAVVPEGSQLDWARQVLAKGTVVHSTASSGSGKMLSFTDSSASFKDIYVQVHAFSSDTGLSGFPCQPLRLTLSSDDATVPGESLGQAVGVGLTQIDGIFYIDLNLQYTPPSITTNFAGIELYLANWCGISLVECGSLGGWDGVHRLQDFAVRIPEDSGLGSGVATFTNGSKAVARVSGTAFGAGWAGRKMSVHSSGNGQLVNVDTVTPPDDLQLLNNWTEPTGDYAFVTWNQMSLYFVPVGPTGIRRPDPTGAAVIVL